MQYIICEDWWEFAIHLSPCVWKKKLALEACGQLDMLQRYHFGEGCNPDALLFFSAINPPEAIVKILDCLGLPSRPPPISPAVQEDYFD